MAEKCEIVLWPSEEGHDPRCGNERPCFSHEPKQWNLKYCPDHIISIECPKCGNKEGPGGVWLLNGELSYGVGRWPCECGYRIEGKYLKTGEYINND